MMVKKIFNSIEEAPADSPYCSIAQISSDIRHFLHAAKIESFQDLDDFGVCDRYVFTLENDASYIVTIGCDRPDIAIIDVNTRDKPLDKLLEAVLVALGLGAHGNNVHIMNYEFDSLKERSL